MDGTRPREYHAPPAEKAVSSAGRNGLIVDGNPALSEMLAAHLSECGELTFHTAPPEKDIIFDRLTSLEPLVVVLDPRDLKLREDRDITDVVQEGRAVVRDTSFIAYTFDTTDSMAHAVFAAGFSGFVSKESSVRSLDIAMSAVLDGGMYLNSRIAEGISAMIQQGRTRPKPPGTDCELSSRERLVLTQIARGISMKEIAANLDLSCKTIETYKARARRKVGLSNNREIFEYVAAEGWLP